VPEPLENLLLLQTARIKLGQAGAGDVSLRGGRLAVTPIELNSRQAKALRVELPGALYESGRSQFSMRVATDAGQQFTAVVQAADALLSVLQLVDEPEPATA